ncbi:tape measure protein [Sporolactobacillus sp. CQH2019]|uniref:tape measure protein n=1 Tax=Sporolactobacillus sp. CQH2019 TaxID=3023512 RepID=UPI002367D675|nr:tape measure protein [Sporolactobacillus sp. CQH2019]MDD9149339.1 tape measure protein [Sporolactobacillus sp. CQH2019]
MAIQNQKALASLVVHVGLDDTNVTRGLSAVKNSVRAATSEWRAQFSIFNTLGDRLSATKAKYEGLSNSIKAQQNLIEAQKRQLTEMGTRTEQNASDFDKLAAQINNNVKQLASLNAQQEKAKHSYEFEQSGIRQDRSELNLLQREMQATIKMYQDQGKEQEASRAKAKGLTDEINKLTQVQGKEQNILNSIASDEGKDSTAYREQSIRVNELSSSIAKAKNEYNDLNKSAFSATARMKSFGESAQKAHDVFKGSFFGTLSANAVSAVFNKISSGIDTAAHSVINSGIAENKTLDSIRNVWDNITKSASKGDAITKTIEEMHVQSNYSLNAVSGLSKAMYGLTGNQKGMKDLATSIMEVGRAKGLDENKLMTISKRLQQIGTSGHITYANVTSMNKLLPGFAEAMAKNMGVSSDQLIQMGKKGQITAKDFENTMLAMGKSNSNAFQNYDHTWAGFSQSMKTSWDELAGKMMKPLFSTDKSGLGALQNMMKSKVIQNGATALGKVIANVASAISQEIPKVVSYLQDHSKQISSFLGTIGNTVKGIWNFSKPLLTFFLDNPKVLIGVATGIGAIRVGMVGLSVAAKLASVDFKAMRVALISTGIGAAVVGIGIAATLLIEHWKQVQKFFAPLGKWFSGIWNGITGGVKSFVNGVGSRWNSMTRSARSTFNSLAKNVQSGFNNARNWAVSATNKMVNQVANSHSWLNKQTNGAARTMFNGLKKTYQDGHKVIQDRTKTFSDFVNGRWGNLGKDIRKTSSDTMKMAGDYFESGYNTLNKLTGGRLGNILSTFGSWGNNTRKVVSGTWSHISSYFGSGLNNVKNAVGNTLNRMWSSISSWGGRVVNFFKALPGNMANGIRNGARALGNSGIYIGNKLIDGVRNVINGVINGINWILKKVSMPTIGHVSLGHVPYFANGSVDSMGRFLQDSIVHVGDGNKPELIKHANGTIEKTPARDTIVIVRKGDSILGGDKTEQLLKSGLKFSLGTWLGSAVDFIKGGWNALTSSADAIWNAMSHPKQLLGTVIDRFAGSAVNKLNGTVAEVASGIVKTVINGVGKWLSNQFGAMGNPPGKGVERWRPEVIRALAMNGLSTSASMVNKVLRQIQTESGGNPGVTQHGYTDINTLTGNLARGLMQVIPPTFNAYKFPGHNNILNGFDNLLAALNYAKHRYGKSLSYLGQGHGYANGGLVTTEQIAKIAEGNNPEVVIPLTDQNRSIQLMYQALDYLTNKQDGNKVSNPSASSSENTNLMNQMVVLQKQNNSLTKALIQVLEGKQFNVNPTQFAKQITPYINQEQSGINLRLNRALGV